MQQAALNGDKQAGLTLIAIYASGVKGREKYDQAKSYYESAAQQGDINSQYYLALMYEGEGDYDAAKYYYRLNVDRGHLRACYRLGMLYEDENVLELAEYYYQLAADNGDDDAQAYLALMYLDLAYYADEDYTDSMNLGKLKKGVKYLLMAARQGNEQALEYDLVDLYRSLNELEEISALTNSAYADDVVAQYQLGHFYELEGHAGRARFYYSMAAQLGFKPAEKKLKAIRAYRDEL